MPNIIRQAQGSCKRRQVRDFREDLETVNLDGSIKGGTPKKYLGPSWHQNDSCVRRFDPQELKNFVESPGAFGGLVETNIDRCDPNCPVHPLFRGLGATAAILPHFAAALRLATRFLTCRHTLPFFHQLITYPLDILIPESQFYNVIQHHMPASSYALTGLPQAEYNLTVQVLVAASQHISFVFIPSETINDKWAYTVRHYPPSHSNISGHLRLPEQSPSPAALHIPDQSCTPYTALLTSLNFQGTNVQMNLSPVFLAVLHPATYPKPTDREVLRATFFLAITLIHELAHAVYMLRVPKATASLHGCSTNEEYEPFYSTQRMAELGHAFESSIFRTMSLSNCGGDFTDPKSFQPSLPSEQGGKISSLANLHSFSLGLGWSRWPSADDVFYVNNPRTNQPIPLARLTRSISTNAIIPRQAPRWRTLYILPDAWIVRFFHASFWENLDVPDAAGGGGIGLRSGVFVPPREFGSRCENSDWKEGDVGVDEGGVDYGGWGGDCESVGRGAEEEGADGQDGQGVVRSGQPWRGFGLHVDDEDEDEEHDDE